MSKHQNRIDQILSEINEEAGTRLNGFIDFNNQE